MLRRVVVEVEINPEFQQPAAILVGEISIDVERLVVINLGLTAVSLLITWAMDPDRDDFYTLINHWNLRHPRQILAP